MFLKVFFNQIKFKSVLEKTLFLKLALKIFKEIQGHL